MKAEGGGTKRFFVPRFWTAALLSLCVLLNGCSGSKRKDPIVVGITPFSGYAYFYLAAEKGYLKDANASFELADFSSLADVRQAYERGQIDVMMGTLMELLTVLSNSKRDAQAFFVIDYSKGADMLLAQKNIHSIADLKGKRIAFEAGTIDMVMVHHALQTAGMTLNDITPVPMPQVEMASAFDEGKVDAVQVYPPVSAQILSSGKGHKLFDSSQVPLTVTDILIADRKFIESKSGELALLVKAFYKAKAFALSHPQEAEAIIGEKIKVRPEDVRHTYSGLEFLSLEDQPKLLVPEGEVQRRLEKTRDTLAFYRVLKPVDLSKSRVETKVVERIQ